MKFNKSNITNKACVYYEENIIYKANDKFLKLTGYKNEDILGKSIEELSKLLKTDINTCFESNKSLYKIYIFTSEDHPKYVDITCDYEADENEVICFTEETSNGFMNGILSTCVDNSKNETISEAIYSYPGLIHLKANANYIKEQRLFSVDDIDLIGSVYKPINHNVLDSIKEKGSFYQQENEFIDKEGNIGYWTINSDLIYQDGEARYLKVIYIDDTEKVLTRKAIEKQKTEMEIILDNILYSIFKVNNKGKYTYVDKATRKRLIPYNLDENSLNNKNVFKYFKYNDINGHELAFDERPEYRVLNGEIIRDYTMIITSHFSTSYHKCSGNPIYDDKGNIESAVLIYENIEDIIKLEEYDALAKNLKNLAINYAVISYDDFKIKYINDNAFKSLQKASFNINNPIDAIGKDFFDYYANSPKEKEEIMANVKFNIEEKSCRYIHKHMLIEDGEVKYIKTIFQPLFDENNQVEQVSVIGMYITDEEIANQQLSKSLKAQDEIFVNTSHELKTPINLIFSASQLLTVHLRSKDSKYKNEKIEYSNKIITQNCYRTIKLINNILDISKMEQGFCELHLKNKNIVDVLDNMIMSISDYIKNKKRSIIFDPKVEEKIMGLDLYKFERIMLNLISNAIKFSNDNGVIFIDLIDKGTFVEVSVKDQGIGIDKNNLESIFTKFKQENKSLNRNVEGTGIGLSLVKSIVDLHGGSINVESDFNVGTKFTVNLPSKIIEETAIIDNDYNA